MNSTRSEGAARVRAEGPISLITASDVARSCGLPHCSGTTIRRWCIGGKSGIRLDSVRIHGELHTSRDAIIRFLSRTYPNLPTAMA